MASCQWSVASYKKPCVHLTASIEKNSLFAGFERTGRVRKDRPGSRHSREKVVVVALALAASLVTLLGCRHSGRAYGRDTLVVALESGHLGGAGLDVYENEPAVLPALLDSDRVVLMPHAGSATAETRREMARMVVEDVRRVLSGEKPLRAVPPESARR